MDDYEGLRNDTKNRNIYTIPGTEYTYKTDSEIGYVPPTYNKSSRTQNTAPTEEGYTYAVDLYQDDPRPAAERMTNDYHRPPPPPPPPPPLKPRKPAVISQKKNQNVPELPKQPIVKAAQSQSPQPSNRLVCPRWKIILAVATAFLVVVAVFVILYFCIVAATTGSKKSDQTTDANSPTECLTATDFTQAWRINTKGSDIRPGLGNHSLNGYACDLYESLKWFRFTGSAGNRMLNNCPKWESCGSKNPFWSDADEPAEVGVAAVMHVYERNGTLCRFRSVQMLVMRCSLETDYDLIYKYNGPFKSPCYSAFCGMM